MKVRKRSGYLIIKLPLLDPPRLSRSGKRLLIASSKGGRRTGLKHEGKPVYANANVYARPDAQPVRKRSRISKSKPSSRRARKR